MRVYATPFFPPVRDFLCFFPLGKIPCKIFPPPSFGRPLINRSLQMDDYLGLVFPSLLPLFLLIFRFPLLPHPVTFLSVRSPPFFVLSSRSRIRENTPRICAQIHSFCASALPFPMFFPSPSPLSISVEIFPSPRN